MDITDKFVIRGEKAVKCIICKDNICFPAFNDVIYMTVSPILHYAHKHLNKHLIDIDGGLITGIGGFSMPSGIIFNAVSSSPQLALIDMIPGADKIEKPFVHVIDKKTSIEQYYSDKNFILDLISKERFICGACELPYDNGFPTLEMVSEHVLRCDPMVHNKKTD